MNRFLIFFTFFVKHWKLFFWSLIISFLIAFAASVIGLKKIETFLSKSSFRYKIPAKEDDFVQNAAGFEKKTYKSILERNLFKAATDKSSEYAVDQDSQQTGKGKRKKSVENAVKSRLPISLVGIIFSGDLYSGIAMIRSKSKKSSSVGSFFVGDLIQKDVKLLEVHKEKIIIQNVGKREFIELKEKKKEKEKKARRIRSRSSRFKKKTVSENFSEEGFERKGNKIVMSSEYRKKMLTVDFTKILQDAKAEPNFVGGELSGFKLTRIKPDSIYEKSGFLDGDVINEINGVSLVDVGQAIRLLQSLRGAEGIEVVLSRNGQEQTNSIQIR